MTVTTHVIEHGVQVTVMDSGVGIPESDIERIFERSYRVEKWRHRREDSSGLGLAIVRSILEAHGSEIKVDSREREGSTFYFRLPIAPPSAMAAAQR